MKHTPGPWSIEDNDIVDSYKDAICTFGVYDSSWTSDELDEMEANAHLTAASPDLLDAAIEAKEILVNVCLKCEEDCNDDKPCEIRNALLKISKAIAKAKRDYRRC